MPTREEVYRQGAPLVRRLVEKHLAKIAAEAKEGTVGAASKGDLGADVPGALTVPASSVARAAATLASRDGSQRRVRNPRVDRGGTGSLAPVPPLPRPSSPRSLP